MNTEIASNTSTKVRLPVMPLSGGAEEVGMTSWLHLLEVPTDLQIILRVEKRELASSMRAACVPG